MEIPFVLVTLLFFAQPAYNLAQAAYNLRSEENFGNVFKLRDRYYKNVDFISKSNNGAEISIINTDHFYNMYEQDKNNDAIYINTKDKTDKGHVMYYFDINYGENIPNADKIAANSYPFNANTNNVYNLVDNVNIESKTVEREAKLSKESTLDTTNLLRRKRSWQSSNRLTTSTLTTTTPKSNEARMLFGSGCPGLLKSISIGGKNLCSKKRVKQ